MKNNIQMPVGFTKGRLKKVAESSYLAELNELAATYIYLDKVTADHEVSAEFVSELNQNRRMSYVFTYLECDFISGNKFLPDLKGKATEYLFNNSIQWLKRNGAEGLPNEYKNYLLRIFKKLAMIVPSAEGEESLSVCYKEQGCVFFSQNVKEVLVKVINKEVKANDSVENILFPLYFEGQCELGSEIEKDALTVQKNCRQSILSCPMLQKILAKTEFDTLLKIDDAYNPLFVAAILESIFRNPNTRTQVLKRFATLCLNNGNKL